MLLEVSVPFARGTPPWRRFMMHRITVVLTEASATRITHERCRCDYSAWTGFACAPRPKARSSATTASIPEHKADLEHAATRAAYSGSGWIGFTASSRSSRLGLQVYSQIEWLPGRRGFPLPLHQGKLLPLGRCHRNLPSIHGIMRQGGGDEELPLATAGADLSPSPGGS